MADPGGRALIWVNGRVRKLRRFATAKPPMTERCPHAELEGVLTGSAMSRGRALHVGKALYAICARARVAISLAWDLPESRRAPANMGSRLGRTVVALGEFAFARRAGSAGRA
jgi:hypothetical protein